MLTNKNRARLAKNCGYNPEKIGAAILKAQGLNVKFYVYSGGVAVTDKTGQLLFYAAD